MLDPKSITNYTATDKQLEELILWWVLAAGKNGITAAKILDKFLTRAKYKYTNLSPFELIKQMGDNELISSLLIAGAGCYTIKARAFRELANSNLNLRTCSTDDLENIFGIGCKTSRCFIIHSRPNQQLAGIDRHLLRWLKDKGYKNIPTSTPSKKRYKEIEQIFLKEVKKSGKSVAELDLEIWNEYRNK